VSFQLSLPYGDTYRGYRLAWTGDPGGPPAASVKGGVVYASWNGKRGIAKWEVLDGSKVVASAPWGGLETAIPVDKVPDTATVRALDAAGRTLGQSTAG
jgi:hypothetical protein